MTIWGFIFLLLPNAALSQPKGVTATQRPDIIIRKIDIEVRDIFDHEELSMLYSSINSLKRNTRPYVVRQELLFKEGDVFDSFLLQESERNLRTLKYLREVEIIPTIEGGFVDILVRVQDTWTLIPQFSFSSGDGRSKFAAGLAESDLFGYGKRFETLYEEDDSRESIEFVYDDRRLLSSDNRLVLGVFDRNDGEIGILSFSKPFRTLVEKKAWWFDASSADTVNRLFANGDERYIYRAERVNLSGRYAVSKGNPEYKLRRYFFGYNYEDDTFTQADTSDYNDLNLDPQLVSNDLALLAENRRFSGPTIAYENLEPNFVSMNYIDRFDRVQDYDLGPSNSYTLFFAPHFLGSNGDSLHVSSNFSRGVQFDRKSFIRGEIGFATRFEDAKEPENTLIRAQLKYYDVLGALHLGRQFIGRHTLATSFFIDYGEDLDRDRELLIGGDNSIRGYQARTFTGDKRFSLNLEDRIHLIDDAFNLISVGAAVFFDAGGSTNESVGRLFTDNVYSNVGAGLRFAFPRSSGERVVRVDLSFPLRDGPDGSDQFEPRIIVSGGQLFSAFLRSEQTGAESATVGVGFDR